MRLGGEICSSDVNMDKGCWPFWFFFRLKGCLFSFRKKEISFRWDTRGGTTKLKTRGVALTMNRVFLKSLGNQREMKSFRRVDGKGLIYRLQEDRRQNRLRAVSLFSWSVEQNARDTQMTTRVTEGARRDRHVSRSTLARVHSPY